MQPRDLPVLAPAQQRALAVPFGPQEQGQAGMSGNQFLSLLLAHPMLSAGIAVGVIALAALACAIWPRTYRATATLMVQFQLNDPLGGNEFPAGLLSSYIATQVDLVRGREVLLPAVDRLQLTEDEDYTSGFDDDAGGLRNWVADRVQKELEVEQGGFGSHMLHITYSANDPDEAAQVANTVAEIYAEQQHTRLVGPARDKAERYSALLRELEAKVNQAQKQVTAHRQRTQLIDSEERGEVGMQLLATLEQRLMEARSERAAAEARAEGDQSVGSHVLSSPMIQTLKGQLAQQTADLAELRATLGERHPDMIALRSQIASTQAALDAELEAYTNNAATEAESARLLEEKLQRAVEEQYARVMETRRVQDEGARYRLELESAQSVYQRALESYDQILAAATGAYRSIDFVSRASPPPRASKPKVLSIMFMAFLLGPALGLGLPLVYELLNRRVRCRDDLERDLGIPVLVELTPRFPRSVS